MGVFQKKRRALSDTTDTLPTQPQVSQITGEHKQGKTHKKRFVIRLRRD
jgi:hypothetical protein